ncbi:LysR family transcriptional regulator [Paenibacillus elgii]|uniref:LysR family transcriptional regulator n=1 Tax=Paenibacillus elgii TaxID=189691 RepID=UPI0009ED40EE
MMTQPAIIQHLASLEAEAGESFFIRTSRKIIPTERGKQLYSQLAPLIESLEETTMALNPFPCPVYERSESGPRMSFIWKKSFLCCPGSKRAPFPPSERPIHCWNC